MIDSPNTPVFPEPAIIGMTAAAKRPPVGTSLIVPLSPPATPVSHQAVDSPSNRDKEIPGIGRSGIAHLWFEVIHPFDDGNGRVGRAIADHALSQSLGYPTTACLATAIEGDKKIARCPNRTASRDLSDLVAKGVIIPLSGGGRTTRYELNVAKPAGFGLGKK